MLSLITHYLAANVLVIGAYAGLRFFQALGEKTPKRLSYPVLLSLYRLFLVCAIALPFLSAFMPKQTFLITSARIWDAPSMRHYGSHLQSAPIITLGKWQTTPIALANGIKPAVMVLLLTLLAVLITRFAIAFYRLRQVFASSHRLRRLGKVEVRIADEIAVPFSFWIPRRAFVFLPSHILENPEEFLIAIRHEVQHHRQRDTQWAYWSEVFRCLFVWNPFSHLYTKQISETQEFACDEALIDRKNVSPQAYGSCLLRVAETARSAHPVLVGTTCMAVGSSGSFLKRRIQHMLNKQKKRYLSKSTGTLVAMMGVTLMAAVAWGSQNLVQDKRINLQEATRLAQRIAKNSSFPITVNEAVVKELNRYVGTPDGREFIRNALARMENYRPLVERKLEQYGLPREFMALPIMESGYENLPQSGKPQYAAGVWQFVPQTARNYGMQVGAGIDDRLNVETETDAACRYIGSLGLRFQNWQLAVLAYNAGENKVQAGINQTGSKNAWTLIEKGFSGDEGYLAKMMAAVLIMNNPSIAE